MFFLPQDHNNYISGNSWANKIQETVDGYTHGLAPLSQILSALWHTVGDYVEANELRELRGQIQAKDKEPDAAEVHQQAAKELYELKAALEQTDMDPADMRTLYRHVVHKYYGPEETVRSIPKEKPSRRADDDKEQGS